MKDKYKKTHKRNFMIFIPSIFGLLYIYFYASRVYHYLAKFIHFDNSKGATFAVQQLSHLVFFGIVCFFAVILSVNVKRLFPITIPILLALPFILFSFVYFYALVLKHLGGLIFELRKFLGYKVGIIGILFILYTLGRAKFNLKKYYKEELRNKVTFSFVVILLLINYSIFLGTAYEYGMDHLEWLKLYQYQNKIYYHQINDSADTKKIPYDKLGFIKIINRERLPIKVGYKDKHVTDVPPYEIVDIELPIGIQRIRIYYSDEPIEPLSKTYDVEVTRSAATLLNHTHWDPETKIIKNRLTDDLNENFGLHKFAIIETINILASILIFAGFLVFEFSKTRAYSLLNAAVHLHLVNSLVYLTYGYVNKFTDVRLVASIILVFYALIAIYLLGIQKEKARKVFFSFDYIRSMSKLSSRIISHETILKDELKGNNILHQQKIVLKHLLKMEVLKPRTTKTSESQ